MKSKLVSLSEAAALVPSGSSLALGGSILRRQPIAFVHELIRQGKMASTSQVNPYTYSEYFRKTLDEGKDLIYL